MFSFNYHLCYILETLLQLHFTSVWYRKRLKMIHTTSAIPVLLVTFFSKNVDNEINIHDIYLHYGVMRHHCAIDTINGLDLLLYSRIVNILNDLIPSKMFNARDELSPVTLNSEIHSDFSSLAVLLEI